MRRSTCQSTFESRRSSPDGWSAPACAHPAGVASDGRSRRGSFLVLVIGILALVSAFMIVYVAVGRADQQLSSAIRRGSLGLADDPTGRSGISSRDEVAEKFARYIAQVIADDTLSTFYTDSSARAKRADGVPINAIPLFREAIDYPYTDWNRSSEALVGDPSRFFDPVGTYRPEYGLAGLPSSWKPSDPWLSSTEPVWLNHDLEESTAPAEVAREYLKRRDWAHITNVAPDGRFVNLHNMRGTLANYVGNFNANHRDMARNLSLTDGSGNPTQATDFGLGSDPNRPAFWTMRQRGAAVPVGSPLTEGVPSSPSYRPYQWADADGDGIYDSRWFEMLDPRLDTGLDYDNPIDVLGITSDRVRYFFAARVVDLSASVNVNTAGDFTAPPDSEGKFGAGSSPTDVDLRRLLGLNDPWQESGPEMISYDKLRINFNPFDDALRPSNYSGYTNDPVPLTPLIGNRAYLSMAYTIERGTIAALADVNSPADKSRFGTNTNTTTGAKSRFEYYASMGVSPDGVSGGEGADTSGNPTYTSRMRSPFGNQDLLELLTYRGANDPSFTSTLESAAGGKYEGPSAMDQEQYLRYSPLRDNRPLALERLSVSARDASSYGTIEPRIYAHLAADVRKRLTTISGARPIRTAEIPVVQSTETNRYEVSADRLQASELKRPSSSVSASSSYQAYADGLAPYSADARAWPGTAEYAAHRFLNYGYRSPEVGLRMSAHMALNLETMRSSIAGEPPMLTVAIWRQMIGNLNGDLVSGLPKPWRDRQYKWSAWPYSSRRGALDASRLSATGADPMGMRVSADAVNVYGVTPQPFITAAASFSIYTDSKGTNDPADSKTYEIGFPTGAPEVEIQGDRTIANSDYLGEVFAVQVVNPFQQSITLGGEIKFTPSATDPNQAVWAATRTRFDYYLEYAGRYYRLAQWSDAGTPDILTDDGPVSVTLGPSESRVFYFTSLPLDVIESRMRNSQDTAEGAVALPVSSDGDPARYFKEWLSTQLSGASFSGKPTFVEQFNPVTGAAIPLTSTTLVDITSRDTTNPTGSTGLVRLWRAMRDPYDASLGNANERWDSSAENPDLPATYASVPEQNLANDLLVDRLRDPNGGSTWRHPVGTGFNKVVGSRGWDWTSDPIELRNARNDNRASGMTFTFAGLVNRRGDEAGNQIERTGLLPAYCVESAFGSGSLSNTAVRTYEIEAGNVKFDVSLRDYQNMGGAHILYKESNSAFDGRDSWFGKQAFAVDPMVNSLPLFNTLGNAPSQWQVLAKDASGEDLQDGAAGMPDEPQYSRSFDSIRPLLWATKKTSTMRGADVLLPLAIGPQFSFRAADMPAATAAQLDERWLTLSEAWALALNYEHNNTVLAASARWKLYSGFGEASPTASPPVYPATDAGRLVIGPSYGDPANPSPATRVLSPFVPFVDRNADGVYTPPTAAQREDVSLGISPAMAVIEQFTSLVGVPSLVKPQFGTVNISTAPLSVLRVLPMLNPTGESTTGFGWWWTNQGGNNSRLDGSVDLAATIASYRDKSWVRRQRDPANLSSPGPTLAFDDRTVGGDPLSDLTNEVNFNGRGGRSDFRGIREQVGLVSAGEILGATRRFLLPGNTAATVSPRDSSNIDFMGWDVGSLHTGGQSRINAAEKGVGSLDYSDMNAVRTDYEVFEDKVLIANAALNSVSARSDFFAVWFVVAGFKSTDVRGLGMNTPMVPSVQRRYVMVVDRSAVTRTGERPRIVFFREVPM